ncbi:hypothetical protein [Polynucleobacter necessarius]|uniref:hypothetical protein n=1 Tax=Polynucleobacter necessarius TaxID=576610 RepID=UPI000E093B8A|nr:hypothetical protein [Polynucleobacter necessarius]
MPSRHISPQSFEDILSELGDDPAIADPHGIRKPNSPKVNSPSGFNHPQIQAKTELSTLPPEWKKYALWVALGIAGVVATIAFFHHYDRLHASQISDFQASEKQVTELKQELQHLRDDMLGLEEHIYQTIDELEVSIHSIIKKGANAPTKPKNQTIAHELELTRWRYLGASRLGTLERAFLHNGKTALMFEIGSVVIGDWRLASINKGSVVLTHAIGKSITLKPSQSE